MNKSLFFGFGFVLFTSLVLLISWLFGLPVKQTETISMQLIKTEQQIQQLSSVHSEFLLHFLKSGELSANDKTPARQDASSVIRGIRDDLEYYNSYHPMSRNKDVSEALSGFSASLDQFEGNLKDFMLASTERGNEHSGLIHRWRELSSQLLKSSSINGTEASRLMEKIKQLETDYLLNGNSKSTEDITLTANEIRSLLSTKEGGIKQTDLDSYLALTSNLSSLDKRIGSETTLGIVANSQGSLNALLVSWENASRLMNDLIVKIRLRWTIIRYLVIAVFTIACIIVLILITSYGITRPLKSTLTYVQKLASGDLPDNPLIQEGLPEIRAIDNALDKMVQGLKEKANLIHSLNQNDLNVNLNMTGNHDVIGRELVLLKQQLTDTADRQKKNDIENTHRRYINEGMAKFGEILRTRSNDIHVLGDAFIREIVKYLDAIQGGFFILSENPEAEQNLELISAFAYNRKKYLQKSIPLGEGLVGTCAREKQIINLTEIPEGYITITSGLGDTRPDNLLLVPVLYENELIGVLEIASLHRYKDHEIQFAGEVAGSLGSTIIYARNNQQTAALLEKSQKQAAEMAEQEEEMRQNMEELKATQEESARREEEFRGIAEAIGHSLFMLEYDLDGIIRNVNDRFCIFLGRTRDEITGKRHDDVMEGSLKTDASFWEELQKNGQINRLETVKIGKKEYLLKEHFSTVVNHDGTMVQYVSFITDLPA